VNSGEKCLDIINAIMRIVRLLNGLVSWSVIARLTRAGIRRGGDARGGDERDDDRERDATFHSRDAL
jgi:hypothetical protein